MSALSEWRHEVSEFGSQARRFQRVCDEVTRAMVAQELGLMACEGLSFDYELRPKRRGTFVLDGTLKCDAVQQCVVSLEPVPAKIDLHVNEEFRPVDRMPGTPEGEMDIASAESPEPIVDGVLAVGVVAFDALACALDPFPRKEGEQLALETDDCAGEDGPFAALAKLKQ